MGRLASVAPRCLVAGAAQWDRDRMDYLGETRAGGCGECSIYFQRFEAYNKAEGFDKKIHWETRAPSYPLLIDFILIIRRDLCSYPI